MSRNPTSLRILCSGDIHIGRRSTRVSGIYRTVEAWSTIVETALAERVHLVALSGDIVDKENATYEAIGPFQEGLKKLSAAGIQTVGVAGNHDFNTLPSLARIAGGDGFRLLGEGGNWESHLIEVDGEPRLEVIGWSFPAEHVHGNPCSACGFRRAHGLPTLGILHADVDAVRSNFAPVSASDLWDFDIDLWLLGHIHAPRVFSGPGNRRALYPGSPLAMDPGEQGIHGPWIAEFTPGVSVSLEQRATSPVRYVSGNVDATGVTDYESFLEALQQTLNGLRDSALSCNDQRALRELSCRIQIDGSTPASREIPTWIQSVLDSPSVHGEIEISIDKIEANVNPPIDLTELSRGNDPVAEIARLLSVLTSDEPLEGASASLVARTHDQMLKIYETAAYGELRLSSVEVAEPEPSEGDAREQLAHQSWKLLSALLAQKERA